MNSGAQLGYRNDNFLAVLIVWGNAAEAGRKLYRGRVPSEPKPDGVYVDDYDERSWTGGSSRGY